MNIAFWSEEDGCGTTSGMAAVASVCSDVWRMKTILMQSSNQQGDLCQKLGAGIENVSAVQEEKMHYGQDGWEALYVLAQNQKLAAARLAEGMVPIVRGRMYYLPQGEYKKREKYPEAVKKGMRQVVHAAERMADLAFVDCGSGRDEMSELLLSQADVVVVSISQERQNLDAYFQNRHIFRGNVVYLVNQYHQESIYNKKNLNRLFRLREEELGVIPNNPVFRHACAKGKVERFIRRHTHCSTSDYQYDFMQELVRTAGIILSAAGIAGCPYRPAGVNESENFFARRHNGKGYWQTRPPP